MILFFLLSIFFGTPILGVILFFRSIYAVRETVKAVRACRSHKVKRKVKALRRSRPCAACGNRSDPARMSGFGTDSKGAPLFVCADCKKLL